MERRSTWESVSRVVDCLGPVTTMTQARMRCTDSVLSRQSRPEVRRQNHHHTRHSRMLPGHESYWWRLGGWACIEIAPLPSCYSAGLAFLLLKVASLYRLDQVLFVAFTQWLNPYLAVPHHCPTRCLPIQVEWFFCWVPSVGLSAGNDISSDDTWYSTCLDVEETVNSIPVAIMLFVFGWSLLLELAGSRVLFLRVSSPPPFPPPLPAVRLQIQVFWQVPRCVVSSCSVDWQVCRPGWARGVTYVCVLISTSTDVQQRMKRLEISLEVWAGLLTRLLGTWEGGGEGGGERQEPWDTVFRFHLFHSHDASTVCGSVDWFRGCSAL